MGWGKRILSAGAIGGMAYCVSRACVFIGGRLGGDVMPRHDENAARPLEGRGRGWRSGSAGRRAGGCCLGRLERGRNRAREDQDETTGIHPPAPSAGSTSSHEVRNEIPEIFGLAYVRASKRAPLNIPHPCRPGSKLFTAVSPRGSAGKLWPAGADAALDAAADGTAARSGAVDVAPPSGGKPVIAQAITNPKRTSGRIDRAMIFIGFPLRARGMCPLTPHPDASASRAQRRPPRRYDSPASEALLAAAEGFPAAADC